MLSTSCCMQFNDIMSPSIVGAIEKISEQIESSLYRFFFHPRPGMPRDYPGLRRHTRGRGRGSNWRHTCRSRHPTWSWRHDRVFIGTWWVQASLCSASHKNPNEFVVPCFVVVKASGLFTAPLPIIYRVTWLTLEQYFDYRRAGEISLKDVLKSNL